MATVAAEVGTARGSEAGRRLWRMRRRHDHIDAVLASAGPAWILTYWRNHRPMLTWRYADEADARTEAADRRRTLEQAGWTSHW